MKFLLSVIPLLVPISLIGCNSSDFGDCSSGNILEVYSANSVYKKQVFTNNQCNDLIEFNTNQFNNSLVYLVTYQEDQHQSTVNYYYEYNSVIDPVGFDVDIKSFENSSLGESIAHYSMDYEDDVLLVENGNGTFQYYPDDQIYRDIDNEFGLERSKANFNEASLHAVVNYN